MAQAHPEAGSYGLRRGVLSPMGTLAQSVSTIAPTTTPVATIPLVCALAGNGTWLAYLLATSAIFLVALCVGKFARCCASPGSLYTYASAQIASPSHPINGQQYTYGYQIVNPDFSPISLPNGQPYLNTYEGGNIDLRVPYVGYSSGSESYNAAGISAYNALQTHIEKRMSHGFQLGFSYTYSHATDEQSALGLFYNGNNPLNLREAYGSSDFDCTHVFNFNFVYQLPKFTADSASLKSRFTNGWAVEGLAIFQSGQPFSVIDYSGAVGSVFYGVSDGITNPIAPLAAGCSPKTAVTGHSGATPGLPALNAACFTIPLLAPGALGGAIPSNDP
jgi:hypothetical protein